MSLFGCDNIVGRSCNDCPETESNKVVQVVLVKKGTTIDVTNPTTFIQNILTARAACNAEIITNVAGAYDGGALATGKGPGKATERILSGTHTLTFTDFDYIDNADFWNKIKYSARSFDLYYFTSNYGWKVTNTGLSISPKPAVTEDINTLIEAEITIKWSGPDNPLPFRAEVDDLESCVPLFDTTSKHFSAASGDQSVIAVGSATVSDQISATTANTIHVLYATGVAFSSFEVSSGTLPTGLVLSKSGTNLKIDGTPSVTGTHNLTIRVSNDCGVSADFSVTFVIS